MFSLVFCLHHESVKLSQHSSVVDYLGTPLLRLAGSLFSLVFECSGQELDNSVKGSLEGRIF